MRAISVRMKLVVPFTMPCTRSMWAAASVSEITRMAGTTPATAASKRSCTPPARAASNSSSPCWDSSCLLAVTTCRPAPIARSTYSRAGSVPPDQLDDQVAALEDVVEVAAAAGQHARQLGAAADLGLDRVRARPRAAPRSAPRPCRGRAARPGTGPQTSRRRQVVEGLAADDQASVAVAAEHTGGRGTAL